MENNKLSILIYDLTSVKVSVLKNGLYIGKESTQEVEKKGLKHRN